MSRDKTPVIVFLTTPWTNVDENIRQGKEPGGVPSVAGIWKYCLRHGFETHVFVLSRTGRDWPKTTVAMDGVVFHWVRQPFQRVTKWLHDRRLIGLCKPLWLLWQLQMIWRLYRAGIRPDIIYSMRGTFAVIGSLWSRIVGAGFVQRQYGTWLYHAWFEQKKWLPRLKILGALLTFFLPTDLYIITNDGTRGDRVAKWVRFPMNRFRFWINGVNKDLRIPGFDRAAFKERLGIPASAPVLLTIGRLSFWKRLDRTIKALPEIRAAVPETRLLIVGAGELRSELEGLARSCGVSDAVMFTGPIEHNRIREYLNVCDIFVMVNDLTNMCNTLIEALTAGCCVVTRDVGATDELIEHNRNGVMLPPDRDGDLARVIIDLLNNPAERATLGETAYELATQRFQTWQERMDMEVDNLKAVIANRVSPRSASLPSKG
jgi:glycosyltransferase involved in cell wall biosynthesis